MQNNTKAILLALVCTVIVSIAQILLKLGSTSFSLSLNQVYNYPLLLGIVLYFAGAVVLVYGFRLGELSVVYPIMASSYVIVTILSSIYLQEPIIPQKWISLSVITLGVIIIGRGGNS